MLRTLCLNFFYHVVGGCVEVGHTADVEDGAGCGVAVQVFCKPIERCVEQIAADDDAFFVAVA